MKLSTMRYLAIGLWLASLLLLPGALGQQSVPMSVIIEGRSLSEMLPPGIELPPGAILPDGWVDSAGESEANAEALGPEGERLRALLGVSFDRDAPRILAGLASRLEGSTATNEVQQFQESVVTGDWMAVGQLLSTLPDDHGSQVYRHLLQGLQGVTRFGGGGRFPGAMGVPDMPEVGMGQDPNQQGPASLGGPALVAGDVLALAGIAPHPLTAEDTRALGQLLARLLSRGDALEPLLPRLEQGVNGLGGRDPAARRRAAELLLAADRLSEAARFLIPIEEAKAGGDWDALARHARELIVRGGGDGEGQLLQQAWEINQYILGSKDASAANREEALQSCFELMPRLAEQVGADWLRASFRSEPSRGLAILGAVCEAVRSGYYNRDTGVRAAALELQKRAVDTFLSVADADQPHWTVALNLLAQAWLQEAAWSEQMVQASGMGGNPVFDQYGNVIAYDSYNAQMMQHGPQIPPIDPDKLVLSAPAGAWLSAVDEGLRLALLERIARLHFKTADPEKALPVIEMLAAVRPKEAGNLVDSLLQAWATARNPSTPDQFMRQRMISRAGGIVYYGGNPMGGSMSGIPLTRAMQARNIAHLAGLLRRLEAMKLEAPGGEAVLQAFVAAHSPAEVFRVADVEAVLGPMQEIRPMVLTGLVQTMRERLAREWRSPRLQEEVKTRRTDKEIEAEVLRGYDTVQLLIAEGLRRSPGDWRLNLARAAVLFDLAEFQYGRQVDLEIYVQKREEAFGGFEQAASLYAAALPGLPEMERGPAVYQQWFNANLGASDLAYVTRQQAPETNQLSRIRAAMLALPGEAASRHLAAFARELGQQAGSIPPELKPRYLRAGLVIAGDCAEAQDARRLVTYYDDLLREIELVVRLDGEAVVGHSQPFGVFVTLQHTAELEREAGGFARYLVDTKNYSSRYYNPYQAEQQRNFIEDFDRQVREKLVDHLEVRSITFLDEKTRSRGCGREGWRETPLAYLLLQAKDGAVDQLPPFQMDLDFADTAGPVVLSVQSTAILLDARGLEGAPRPVHSLEVVQVLDDRELAVGKLILEVKASGKGLVPGLEDLLQTGSIGFQVEEREDLGLTVMQVDTEGDQVAALTERNWVLRLKVPEGESTPQFRFPRLNREDATVSYKRYVDADLVAVEPELALAGLALRPRRWWTWVVPGMVLALIIGGGFWWYRRREPASMVARPVYAIPDRMTPFAVINLLRAMSGDVGLKWSEPERLELHRTLGTLERHYFARQQNGDPEPDLPAISRRWADRAGYYSRAADGH